MDSTLSITCSKHYTQCINQILISVAYSCSEESRIHTKTTAKWISLDHFIFLSLSDTVFPLSLLFSHQVMFDSFVTPWPAAHSVPLSMGFPRQEYWSGWPFPSRGDLSNPGSNLPLQHCRQILHHWGTRKACISSTTRHKVFTFRNLEIRLCPVTQLIRK